MATRKSKNSAQYKIVKIDSQFTPEGFSDVDFDLIEDNLAEDEKKTFPSTLYLVCDNKKLIAPFTIGTSHFLTFRTFPFGKVFNDSGLIKSLKVQSLRFTLKHEVFSVGKY